MRKNASAAPVPFKPWLTALLAIVLTLSSFASLAYAEDTVTGLSFDNPPSPARLYIDDDALQLDALASISGSASLKNVTTDAAWSTSNSAIVKVTSGLLTAVAKGSATVTATYKGFKVSLPVSVDYLYDSVTIKNDGSAVDSAVDVKLGDKLAYGLSAAKSGSSDRDVTKDAAWTSSSTGVATVEDGEITLLTAGTTTITAKYKGRSDTVKLTVTSPYKSLSVMPGGLMEFTYGDNAKSLTATALTTAGATEDVTSEAAWTTSSASVVTVDKGVVTPVGNGTATITSTYLGASGSVTVVVRPAYEAMRLTPKDDQNLTLKDEPVAFTAVVQNGGEEPITVTDIADWTSSNVYAATVDKGVVTPKGIGSTVIKVSYKGVTQQVNVTVYPTVASMTAAKDAIDVFLDDAVTLPKITATTLADEKVDVSSLVNWTSSNTDVFAKVDGKWKAKKTGTATLTGSIRSKTVTIKVTVHEQPLLLTADQSNLSVVLGKEAKLPAMTMTYASGDEEDVTSLVTWKSSSPNLIVKTPNVKGIQASSVTLTASYLGKSATVRVTIEEEIKKLLVDNSAPVFSPGRSYTLKVTGVYKSGKSVSLTSKMNWTMDPEALAAVKGSSIKTLKEGTGKLTGSYQGKSVVLSITVVGKLKKLIPTVKTLTLAPGASQAVKVTGEYEGGRNGDVTKAAAWTTGNNRVATVQDGVITAAAKGTTYIRGTLEGKTVSIRVTVKP
ncbi:Ig-like domain-containing protein [Paenibacillus sp. GCM10023250]|uniref:Ig-like domain-containing protein n=1 Tax=Paenibacillus sp. GCM10023250 TaxID=3252648 RepID=UPI00361B5FA9